MPSKEDEGLENIKARMTDTQRKEMAEIIQKEMERRGMIGKKTVGKKSKVASSSLNTGLNNEQMKELYGDVGEAIQQLRLKKLEAKVEEAKKRAGKEAKHAPAPKPAPADEIPLRRSSAVQGQEDYRPSSGNVMRFGLIAAVVALGVLKVLFATGIIESVIPGVKSDVTPAIAQAAPEPAPQIETARASLAVPTFSAPASWSKAEKEILTQLDARRVEIEKRKEALDRREADLTNQAQALAERLAELRGLSAKLAELRKERDRHYETRLEQLANVYGAMEPAEAAILIAKLEDKISLELLERLPEKRMGQILSFMEKDRAVDLTRMLTEKKLID